MKISYYELLGMVQEGNAPKKIEVSLTYGTSREYYAEYDGDEFNYYRLDEDKLEDENYKDYLSECFLESTMFDKCITILDKEEFEDTFSGIKYFKDGKCYMSFSAPLIPKEDIESILDEEDEFEDIEEFQSFITNVGRVDNANIELYIHTLFKQQTQLINNQKKIIEKLKEEL